MHCRPDQIVNPATGRCVSRYGKIGQNILQGRKKQPKSKSKVTVSKTIYKKFDFWTRSNSANLTSSQINIAKQFGVSILDLLMKKWPGDIQLDGKLVPKKNLDRNGNYFTLEGKVKAKNKSDVEKWLRKIGATPILHIFG